MRARAALQIAVVVQAVEAGFPGPCGREVWALLERGQGNAWFIVSMALAEISFARGRKFELTVEISFDSHPPASSTERGFGDLIGVEWWFDVSWCQEFVGERFHHGGKQGDGCGVGCGRRVE